MGADRATKSPRALHSLGESLWVTGALSPPTHVLSRKRELVSNRNGPKNSQVPWELEAATVNIVKLPSPRSVEEGETAKN